MVALFVLGTAAAAGALLLRGAGVERERAPIAGTDAKDADAVGGDGALASGTSAAERMSVELPAGRTRVEPLDELIERLARGERDLLRGSDREAAQLAVERAVGALVARDDVLARIGGRRAAVGAPDALGAESFDLEAPGAGARTEDRDHAWLQLMRYGSVRAFYWVVQERSGPMPATVPAADVERAREEAARAVLEAVDQVATLEIDTATFLADTLVALFEGESVVRPDALLERLMERRLRFAERAALYDRVLLAFAQRLDEGTRLALSRWLMADPSDASAVTLGLESFFACGRAGLALELAREGFEAADDAGRAAIAEAVARSAPPDDAAAFLLERARETASTPAAWMALGAREDGGLEALAVAYQGLRAVDDNPVGRRLAVMAMDAADPLELRWIATDDPDPAVQGQAVLTLSARAGRPADGDVDAAIDVLERAGPATFAFAASAAGNLLRRAAGDDGRAQRERLVESLKATVLDEGNGARVAQRALDVLEGWVAPAEFAWLASALDAR